MKIIEMGIVYELKTTFRMKSTDLMANNNFFTCHFAISMIERGQKKYPPKTIAGKNNTLVLKIIRYCDDNVIMMMALSADNDYGCY